MDMSAFVNRIEEITRSAVDVVAPLDQVRVNGDATRLYVPEVGDVGITQYGHGSLADTLDIPRRYYTRMQTEDPELLSMNVSRWLGRSSDSRMIRVSENAARAFLSPSYHRIDHIDVLGAVGPALQEANVTPVSTDLTERRMYLKVTSPKMRGDIVPGDTVQAGLVISNSEVGAGAFRVELFTLRLVCTNGMVVPDYRIRKVHRGAELDDGILSDRTRMLDDAAFVSYVRDSVKALTDGAVFASALDRMREVNGAEVKHPQRAVKVLAKKTNIGRDGQDRLLAHFIGGGNNSVWGLLNAATAYAKEAATPDARYEIERNAGLAMMDDGAVRELMAA